MKLITFADKISTIISSLPAINRIRAEDINEIKSVVNHNAGTEIYSDTDGSNTDINFTSAITNADEIEIIFTRINSTKIYTTGKIPYFSGVSTTLEAAWPVVGSNILQLEKTQVTITDTKITFDGGYMANITSSGVQTFNTQTDLYIKKVIIY